MEQEKLPQQENEEATGQNKSYIWVLLAVVIFACFCIRIYGLEKELNILKAQIEECKLTLTGVEQEKSDNTVAESPSVSTDGGEVTEDSAAVEDKQQISDLDIEQAKHKVYLTFDDGPSSNTEAILDILDEYNIKATFFVLGKEDETSKERLRMIYERGHTIGMHSYSHVYSEIYGSLENFQADFWKSKQYLLDTIGAECTYYRFPGGSSNTATSINIQECIEFLKTQGVEYYDWNVISGDGSSRKLSTEEIVKNCTDSITNYGTSIILLHDASSKTETVEALPVIIETILAMEDTVILPITEETKPVHHVVVQSEAQETEEQISDGVATDAETEQSKGSTEETIEQITGEQ